ncbi:MFS transporter [Streptomyces boninensis]|uniref:MFS transporter n=1 Tax=Streptomyces boninensis TaxID=2039455 RepID=UPI003B227F19
MRASPRARLAALSVTHAVDDVYQGAVPALIPFLVAERHYTYAAATGITLAATFLSSVVQPAFGVLTDRRGLGWLVPAGVVTAGVGVGLAGLSATYALTWLAIALSGLGVAAYHPEAARAARAAAGGSAGSMSWFVVGGNLGYAAGPLLVTPVLAVWGLGATPLLAIPAVVTGVALVAVRGRAAEPRKAPSVPAPRPVSPALQNWPAFRRLSAVVVCRSICFFGVASFLSLYVTRHLDGSRAQGTAALTLFLAAGALGTVLGGRLADRRGRVTAVRVGYALALPGLAALLLAPGPAAASAAAVLLGLGLYLPFSVQVTLAQEYVPGHTGTAAGVTLGLAVSVGGVASPALGQLADHAGLSAALATLFAFPVAALLLTLRLPEPVRDPAEPAQPSAAASRRSVRAKRRA